MGMRLEIDIPEHHYNNIMDIDSMSLGRAPYKGIIMFAINAIKRGKVLEQEPKTGYWIFVGEENEEETRNGNFRYVCSECCHSDVHAKSTEVPYCWHCGAKMAESEEDNGHDDN